MDTGISDSCSGRSTWPIALCAKCWSATRTREGLQQLLSRDGYFHHFYEELRSSAEHGCVFCKILWGFLSSTKLSVADYPTCGSLNPVENYCQVRTVLFSQCNIKENTSFGSSSDRCLLTDIVVGWTCEGRKCHVNRQSQFSRSIKLQLHTDEDDDDSGIPLTHDGNLALVHVNQQSPTLSITDKSVIETMRQQLARCLETHSSYCPSRFDVGLPSRVIDVDSEDNAEGLSLHIRNLRERGQYVALSYCWGEPPHPFTTTTELIQHPSQRDWSQLPASIRDAVWVTRALGLRYLWIDSLCIVQDDESDKLREIQLMGTIYKNATVTIAAARSSHVEDGFLDDINIPKIPIPLVGPNGELRKLWVHTHPPERPDEPLDKRGWTLQESLLSPRILYYGSKDLIWKCRGEPFHGLVSHRTFYRPPLHERLPPAVWNIPSRETISTDGIWMQIQSAFLCRQFKIPQDRFFALSGVAHELQRISGDVYIAGMWKSTIMRQLSWKRTINISPHVLAQQSCISPSWSWLAHFRPLVTLPVDENPLDNNRPKLLSWSLKLADESAPLGCVLGGHLRIVGTVVKSIDGHDFLLGSGILTLDYDIPKEDSQKLENFLTEEYTYLYLGYRGDIQHGLLLRRLEDGLFMRQGHLAVEPSIQDLWASPLAQRMEMILV